MQHRHHRLGDGHVHAKLLGALHHGLGAVNTLGHMAQRLHGLRQGVPLGQLQTHLPVATEVAGGGQHKIAQAGQAHVLGKGSKRRTVPVGSAALQALADSGAIARERWAAAVERYGKQAGSRPSWER